MGFFSMSDVSLSIPSPSSTIHKFVATYGRLWLLVILSYLHTRRTEEDLKQGVTIKTKKKFKDQKNWPVYPPTDWSDSVLTVQLSS